MAPTRAQLEALTRRGMAAVSAVDEWRKYADRIKVPAALRERLRKHYAEAINLENALYNWEDEL